jgi:hypothetical protein
MVKLYYPPAALLPMANREFVELAGAKCILAMNEEKQLFVISNVFSEVSWGEFWKEAAISDQIEKITVKHDDSDAIYDPQSLADRIKSAFEKIIENRLLFFGVASFEGNAFETVVFDEMEISREESDKLMNLYKSKRVGNAFPNIKKGQYCEINFFGEASVYFSLPNKKNIKEIASTIQSYEGNASGIVAVAQGAANFIILTENIGKCVIDCETRIDRKNLTQMFHLLKKGILAAPISWFKIDLGLRGIETLENWEEIKDSDEIRTVKRNYFEYLHGIIAGTSTKSEESILADDIGKPIDLRRMNDVEILTDLDNIMGALNELNELEISDEAISLLYHPPKVLFSYGDKTGAAIGGSTALLSIDVGKNIYCVGDLRHYLSWGEYYKDADSDEIDSFDGFKNQSFFELENPAMLRDIYMRTFQTIIKNSHIFLGLLELENNAFEFCLFPDLDLSNEDLKKIQSIYRQRSYSGKFPKLQDGYIKITWSGNGKDYFINSDALGILDLAEKIKMNPIYQNGHALGIACVDPNSTYFYILTSNFDGGTSFVDFTNLQNMYQKLENTDMAPLCWFKISLGLDTLKLHPFWRDASQYTSLLLVLDNYRKYIADLLQIKQKEDRYRVY